MTSSLDSTVSSLPCQRKSTTQWPTMQTTEPPTHTKKRAGDSARWKKGVRTYTVLKELNPNPRTDVADHEDGHEEEEGAEADVGDLKVAEVAVALTLQHHVGLA